MAIVNSPHSCGLDLGPHTGCPPGVRKCTFWKGGSIGVGPRSACGINIIDNESWERWGGGGGVPDGQPCYSTCLVKCDFYTLQCVGWMVRGGGWGGGMAGYRRSPLVTWDCCIWSGTWEDQSPCMIRLAATTPLRVCTHTGAWGRSLFHGSQLPGGGGGGGGRLADVSAPGFGWGSDWDGTTAVTSTTRC